MNWYRLIIIFTIFLAVGLTIAGLQDYKYISSIIKLFAFIIIIFVFYNSRKKYNGVLYPANISKKKLEEKVFELYESEKVLVFDLDGTLIEAGLETGEKQNKTLESYILQKEEILKEFNEILSDFRNSGIEVIICTGRGEDFAAKVGKNLLNGNYDTIISEGGVLIKNKDEKTEIFRGLEKNIRYLEKIAPDLLDFVNSIGGFFEEGTQYIYSFNPPLFVKIEKFKAEILKFLEKKFPDYKEFLEVTNSKTAVDILPFGTNKMKALNEVLTGRYMIYFGDSENDLPAFKEAKFGVIPGNATKKFVKKVVKSKNLTFVALGKEIDGVLDGLKYLNKILGYEGEDSE